jgi:hypothetical protein
VEGGADANAKVMMIDIYGFVHGTSRQSIVGVASERLPATMAFRRGGAQTHDRQSGRNWISMMSCEARKVCALSRKVLLHILEELLRNVLPSDNRRDLDFSCVLKFGQA